MNRKSDNNCIAHSSTDTSGIKYEVSDTEIRCNPTIGYKIINFLTVFHAISQYVKCKKCNGDITFEEAGTQGLGFKLVLVCDKCEPKYINSSPVISDTYEINKRFIFATELLSIDLQGIENFCALMDFSRPIFQSLYDSIEKKIFTVLDVVNKWSREKYNQQQICKIVNNSSTDNLPTIPIKKSCSGITILDAASYMGSIIQLSGFKGLLKVYEMLEISIGPNLNGYCDIAEEKRMHGDLTCMKEIMQKGICPAATKMRKITMNFSSSFDDSDSIDDKSKKRKKTRSYQKNECAPRTSVK